MAKILCPKHEDTTPSLEVYEDSAWCFAGCGFVALSEIGLDGIKQEVKPIEDVEETLRYVAQLPLGSFRGFSLPYDHRGFYIVWGNAPFYKQRLAAPKGSSKYRGPSGHKPPLFWARSEGLGTLLVVEGELEALSAAEAVPEWDVLSPGSASQFVSKTLTNVCHKYYTVIVATDNDAPGVKAARELATELLYKVPKLVVFYKNKDRDFNKVFMEAGANALRKSIEHGLQEAVSWESS